MGLGSTAKKLQSLADTAEDLYARLNDVRTEVADLRTALEETSEQVDRLEREAAAQRALLEALADEQGVDVEATLSDADVGEPDDAADAPPADE